MTVPDAARWPGQEHRRLTEAVGYADVVLGAVSARLLPSPTPCRAWNLRMLMEHADDSLAVLLEGLTAQRIAEPPAPVPSDTARSVSDLVGAFRRRAAELLDASAEADGGSPVSVRRPPGPPPASVSSPISAAPSVPPRAAGAMRLDAQQRPCR